MTSTSTTGLAKHATVFKGAAVRAATSEYPACAYTCASSSSPSAVNIPDFLCCAPRPCRLQDIPGASVEHNNFCVSAHFRNCATENWQRVVVAVNESVAAQQAQLHVTRGRKVLEVRPQVSTSAIHWLHAALRAQYQAACCCACCCAGACEMRTQYGYCASHALLSD
jgi:hypothetical protein